LQGFVIWLVLYLTWGLTGLADTSYMSTTLKPDFEYYFLEWWMKSLVVSLNFLPFWIFLTTLLSSIELLMKLI